MLSRKFMPTGMGHPYVVPECLVGVEERLLPMRDAAYYRSVAQLQVPPATQEKG